MFVVVERNLAVTFLASRALQYITVINTLTYYYYLLYSIKYNDREGP